MQIIINEDEEEFAAVVNDNLNRRYLTVEETISELNAAFERGYFVYE